MNQKEFMLNGPVRRADGRVLGGSGYHQLHRHAQCQLRKFCLDF